MQVAGHELWHSIERDRPDLIAWYRDNSRQFYKDFQRYKANLNQLLMPDEAAYSDSAAESD